MPERSTVLNWAVDLSHPFFPQYAHARDVQADTLADEIQDIADDGSNDYVMTQYGIKADHEHIQRSRLRVDTRKWIASKLKPKRYGEKIQQEVTGLDGQPLIPDMSKEERKALALKAMLENDVKKKDS